MDPSLEKSLISLAILGAIVLFFAIIGLACCYFKSLWEDKSDSPPNFGHKFGSWSTIPGGASSDTLDSDSNTSENRRTLFAIEFENGTAKRPQRLRQLKEDTRGSKRFSPLNIMRSFRIPSSRKLVSRSAGADDVTVTFDRQCPMAVVTTNPNVTN